MKIQYIIRLVLTAIPVVFMWANGEMWTSIVVTGLVVANELNVFLRKKIFDAVVTLQAEQGREG